MLKIYQLAEINKGKSEMYKKSPVDVGASYRAGIAGALKTIYILPQPGGKGKNNGKNFNEKHRIATTEMPGEANNFQICYSSADIIIVNSTMPCQEKQ
ncbi:MAG: hypothetical protein V8S58_13625 [Lachnospiraceae bacterium]